MVTALLVVHRLREIRAADLMICREIVLSAQKDSTGDLMADVSRLAITVVRMTRTMESAPVATEDLH